MHTSRSLCSQTFFQISRPSLAVPAPNPSFRVNNSPETVSHDICLLKQLSCLPCFLAQCNIYQALKSSTRPGLNLTITFPCHGELLQSGSFLLPVPYTWPGFFSILRYPSNVRASSLVCPLPVVIRNPIEADWKTPQLGAGINDKKTFKNPESIQLQQAEYIHSLRNIIKYGQSWLAVRTQVIRKSSACRYITCQQRKWQQQQDVTNAG